MHVQEDANGFADGLEYCRQLNERDARSKDERANDIKMSSPAGQRIFCEGVLTLKYDVVHLLVGYWVFKDRKASVVQT